MREGKKHCKWYNDEFCTNGESPCVADYCPVVEYPELCKCREVEADKDINVLSKEDTEIDVGMIEKSVLFDKELNKEQYVWLLKGSIWKTYNLSKVLDLIHSLQSEKKLAERASKSYKTIMDGQNKMIDEQKAEIERLTEDRNQLALCNKGLQDGINEYQADNDELGRKNAELQKQVDELKEQNDIKPTEDCQHSENVPQEKCQIPPEMPDSIAGVPLSDLLFITRMLGGHIDVIEKIKDGYAFGHAVGYEDGFKQFHQQLTKTLERINTEPIKLVDKGGVYEIKSNLDIAYNPQDAAMDMARYWNEKVTASQDIAVFNPSLMDGKDKK